MLYCAFVSQAAAGASGSVQSVDRAIAILELLADEGEMQVSEVAEALSIHKSTASRLLSTLERRGLVDQPLARGSYRLGYALLHLSTAVTANFDLTREAKPICQQLCDEVQETVNVAVRHGNKVVNIDQIIASASVVVHVNWIGKRNPLHATSPGKVLLAYLPQEELEDMLDFPLQSFTDNTIVERRRLTQELAEVRRQGYSRTVEELELGLNAVGAPIWGFDGEVIAALSVTGPAYRLTVERMPEVAARAVAAAGEISQRLGFPGAQ